MKTQATKPNVALTAIVWWVTDKIRLQAGFSANIASGSLSKVWKRRRASLSAMRPCIRIIPQNRAQPLRLAGRGAASIRAAERPRTCSRHGGCYDVSGHRDLCRQNPLGHDHRA